MFSTMTSAIATIRLPLQASISLAGGQFVVFIYKGRGASGSPYEDNDSGSSISLSMVAKRNSRSWGDDSTAYVILDDATSSVKN